MVSRDSMPLVSIVVLNYNGGKLLPECVRSLLSFTEYTNFEILIVDNCSNDNSIDSVEEISRDSDKVRIILLEKNYGYAEGNNIAYSFISPMTKYVVFMNNDIVVNERWLEKLVYVLEENKDIGAAQPRILTPDVSPEGLNGGFIDVFGYTVYKPETPRHSEKAFDECFYAWGATLIARKRLIEKIGLFNPDYFLQFEETDFCWRLRLAGYKVAVVPSSTVNHVGSVTIKKYFTSVMIPFHTTKNRAYMLMVNYQVKNVLKYASLTLISEVVDFVRDVLMSIFAKGRKRSVYIAGGLGRLKGLVYLWFHFPKIWKKRLLVQRSIRKVEDDELLRRFIILPNPCLPSSILRKTKALANAI